MKQIDINPLIPDVLSHCDDVFCNDVIDESDLDLHRLNFYKIPDIFICHAAVLLNDLF